MPGGGRAGAVQYEVQSTTTWGEKLVPDDGLWFTRRKKTSMIIIEKSQERKGLRGGYGAVANHCEATEYVFSSSRRHGRIWARRSFWVALLCQMNEAAFSLAGIVWPVLRGVRLYKL